MELTTEDLPASRRFYETACGLEFHEDSPEYAGIRAPDGDGEVRT